jgi:hypothetical protein
LKDFPLKIQSPAVPFRVAWKTVKKADKTENFPDLESDEIFKRSIEAKLLEAGAPAVCQAREEKWFTNFQRCGVESYVMMCEGCQRTREAHYQCSQRFCPRCAWRIAGKRRALISKMTSQIYGVKHVVLTQRNFSEGLSEKIRESRKNLFALRRQKIFGRVTGGCASLELTNEDRGWHLHWHMLIQSQFIPASELSIAWGKLVGQEFAIVKVLDVSEKSYVHEICKYVAKGSDIARWSGAQILEFILALRSVRTFSTFGKFRELQKFARALLEIEKPEAERCDCGSQTKIFAPNEEAANRIWEKLFMA